MGRSILEALAGYFPGGLVLNTGAFTALSLVLLFLGFLFWQALTKLISGLIEKWLKAHARLIPLLFFYALPLLVCLTVHSFYAAAVMSLPALLAARLYAKGQLSWSLSRVVLSQLVIFIAAVGLQGLAPVLNNRIKNDHLKVYVVLPVALPLQPGRADDLKETLDLSRRFRDEIGGIFGPAVEVQVEPRAYSAIADLDDWRELQEAVERIHQKGLQPDLVLVNQASVTRADGDFINLLLRVKVHSPKIGKDAFFDLKPIVQLGRLRNLSHLALRASIRIVDEVQGTTLALNSAEENLIGRKILERYQDLLTVDGGENPAPPGVLESVSLALQSPSLSYERVKEILDAYPGDESEHLREVVAARAHGLLSRINLRSAATSASSPAAEDLELPARGDV